MDWKKLQIMKCPSCSEKLKDNSMGYECTECTFSIGHEKFMKIVNEMMVPKKNLYDPDTEDRTGWE